MADIFISYKREERRLAERLSIALEQLGFDVWWDFELLSGDRYRNVIRAVIDQCSAAIVLWSKLSVDSDFVMDEATSSLDSISENRIETALRDLQGEVTQILIAHRLSTIEHADKIIFLEKGRKIAEGTIEELLRDCAPFRLMWETYHHTDYAVK